MATIRSDFMIPNGTEADGSTHYDEGKFRTDADLVEPYLYSKPTHPEDILPTDNIQGMVAKLDRKIDYLPVLMRNKAYAVGDIAYSRNLPSYLRLECVTAGTTGATEPDFSSVSTGGA